MSRLRKAGIVNGGLVATVLVTLVVAVAALAVVGGGAGVSSLAGGLLVAAFFGGGIAGIRALLSATTVFAMVGAVALFTTQAFALLVLYDLLTPQPWLDRTWFGVAAVAGTVAWQVGMTLAYVTGRQSVYDDVRRPGDSDPEMRKPA
jgi:hypothetical protein